MADIDIEDFGGASDSGSDSDSELSVILPRKKGGVGAKKIKVKKSSDSDSDSGSGSDSDSEPEKLSEDSDNESEMSEQSMSEIDSEPEIGLGEGDGEPGFMNDSDLEEDDDEEEEDYLKKFDESIQKNIIQENHPELHAHNYEEVDALCTVIRDNLGNIVDPLHKSIPILTRYERARILGERAIQLNAGAQPFVDIPEGMIDGYLIAWEEYKAKKIPFIIQRPMPNGGCEYWRLEDLEIL